MSTRAFVGMENEDGSVSYIYNHFDSFENDLGKWLYENMTSDNVVRDLISCGDASSIKHGEFYADRGEPLRVHTVRTMREFTDEFGSVPYLYLWQNSRWMVKSEKGINELITQMV